MSSLWNNLSGRTLKSDLKTAPPEPADQGTPDAPTPANPTAEQP